MNLNIAICDDEIEQLNILTEYIKKFEIQENISTKISRYDSALSLLQTYSAPNTFHVLFLDVEMPGMTGLELATKIRELPDKDVHIIFVSNYPEYMQSSFNVQAFYYLPKPIEYEDFHNVMLRVAKDYEERNTFKMLLQTDGEQRLVNIHDILYIEISKRQRNHLCYHLATEKIEAKGFLVDVEKNLAVHNFVPASRGFLVNLNRIRA